MFFLTGDPPGSSSSKDAVPSVAPATALLRAIATTSRLNKEGIHIFTMANTLFFNNEIEIGWNKICDSQSNNFFNTDL